VTAPSSPRTHPRKGVRVLRIVIGTVMAVLILAGVAAVTFMHAFGPRDGESIAHQRVDAAARSLQHRVAHPGAGVDAQTLAAPRFSGVPGATVEPYGWRGTTSDPDGARVDIRIRVSVQPQASRALFQPGVAGGSAQACFRFHVREGRASYRSITCPAHLPTTTPTPAVSSSATPAPSPSP